MDNNEGVEASSRGNEWEVVSLTASTYSAAPGQKRVDDDKSNEFSVYDDGTTDALFMSGHFESPKPTEHENLLLESEKNEIDNESKDEGISNVYKSDKINGTDFEEDMGFRGLNLVDKEENIYNSAKFSSLDTEADVGESTMYEKDAVVAESFDSSQKKLETHSDVLKPISPTKEVKLNKYRLPCEALWKRRIASLYKNAKEANAYWSVFVVATLMGLVVIGHRWQQNKGSTT